ncbi:hypothetical protein [Hansschlegelia sp. KR7-227]|uniref:hypothetical protein n=1 Tax=Hansschlegelia sp. KR7-227 TaxID=3400914 RepID=UPI003C03961A
MVNRIGTARADLLTGSPRDDYFEPRGVSQRPPGTNEVDTVEGGAGFDTLSIGAGSSATFIGSAGTGDWSIVSSDGNTNCLATGIEYVLFTGSSQNDVFNTGNATGVIDGGGISDVDIWIADFGARSENMFFDTRGDLGILAVGVTVRNIDRISLTTGGGRDTVLGGDEGDTIVTGAGADRVDAGRRRPLGETGTDVVDCGSGVDTLVVDARTESRSVQLGSGADSFFVRSSSNRFVVDAANTEKVEFLGGSGDDIIDTGTGAVIVRAGAGMDFWIADMSAAKSDLTFRFDLDFRLDELGVKSVTGVDRIALTMGSGDDTVVGGTRGDTVRGGAGDDVADLRTRSPNGETQTDFFDAGAGVDTLIVNARNETAGVSLGVTADGFFVDSDSRNFDVDATNCEKIRFTGGSGNDFINSGSRAERIDGGSGVDTWVADYGATTRDVRFELPAPGSGGAVALTALGLLSLADIERILLTTGAGDDTIIGGGQGDIVNTGAGRDVVDLKTRPVFGETGTDIFNAGAGVDTLVVDARAEKLGVSLGVNGGGFFVRSGSNRFSVDATDCEKVRFTGGKGDDVIDTGAGGVRVDGYGGVDRWIANYGATARDVAFILGRTTDLKPLGLEAIAGVEALSLTTGRGDDRISGGGEGDRITSGAGADTLDGGTHHDGDGGDLLDGGAGIDTLVVDARVDRSALTLATKPSGYVVFSADGRYLVDATAVERVSFTGGAGDDRIDTGRGGVVVDGGAGVDRWIADYGATAENVVFTLGQHTALKHLGVETIQRIEAISIATGRGDDRIVGGREADVIASGGGDDTLDAGMRRSGDAGDALDGGAGFDTLVIYAAQENASGVELTFGGNGAFALRSASGRYALDAVHMEAVDFSGTFRGDFAEGGARDDTLRGNAGADTLDGGLGSDSLEGGGGPDVFRFSTKLSPGNIDRITLFYAPDDQIRLDDAIFSTLDVGQLKAGQFRIGPRAEDADDRVIFRQSTGGLLYDADGVGGADAVQFATIAFSAGTIGFRDFSVV